MELERVVLGANENGLTPNGQDISNGVSTTFTLQCKRKFFRPENMHIQAIVSSQPITSPTTGLLQPGPSLAGLYVTDIKIGTNSLMASDRGFLARLFAEDSVLGAVTWREIGNTDEIKVTLQNNSSSPLSTVMVSIIGRASRE